MYHGQNPKILHGIGYVAKAQSETLQALLSEAFYVLGKLYMLMDRDHVGLITFNNFIHFMHDAGLYGEQITKMQNIFVGVDIDRNGTLDLAEFLCMMFSWGASGEKFDKIFGGCMENALVVDHAFRIMSMAWAKYDSDRSQALEYSELIGFLKAELPDAFSFATAVVDEIYPESIRSVHPLPFRSFMHLLCELACDCCDSHDKTKVLLFQRLPGSKSSQIDEKIHEEPDKGGAGPQSAKWKLYVSAFAGLEADFMSLDKSKDGMIDIIEISQLVDLRPTYEKLDILTRLENKFRMVDEDRNNTLDFYEFVALAFLMAQDGTYSEMIPTSQSRETISRMFTMMTGDYIQQILLNQDKNRMGVLTKEGVAGFFNSSFSVIPTDLDALYDEMAKVHHLNPSQKTVDVAALMKILYHVILPGGMFDKDKYHPQHNKLEFASLTVPKATTASIDNKRISPVINSKFVKGKMLGQGGQGAVYLGSYDGNKVAGKEMLEGPTPQVLEDLKNEVELLMQLNHPNCHFLLGAKVHSDSEGFPLLLTEVCDEGSVFDLYAKKKLFFPEQTAWRFGYECALGLEHLHSLGYMHRDIKSLNVFVTSNFVAKVADFGMATNSPTASDVAGTPQWMAPEVAIVMFGQQSVYDKRCDIYSYAIMLWEFYNCSCPYAETGLQQPEIAHAVITQQIRPSMQINPNWQLVDPTGQARILIQRCWSQNPADRPATFTQIAEVILVQARCGHDLCNQAMRQFAPAS